LSSINTRIYLVPTITVLGGTTRGLDIEKNCRHTQRTNTTTPQHEATEAQLF